MPLRASGSAMKNRRTFWLSAGIGLVSFLVLFDVDFAPEFALPGTLEVDDPAQEARYAACFDARDAAIHERAFATIDNPDVQKEYIAMQRDGARLDCRAAHPRRRVRVDTPLRFNLVDVAFRFRSGDAGG